MFERCTDHFKRAIYFAEISAWHLGSEQLLPRDILIGLTWDSDSRAERIASLKTLAVELRAQVNVPHLPITAIPYVENGRALVPLHNDCKKILAYAQIEADRDGEYWVDSDYLLRGLLTVKSDAQAAVEKFGSTLKDVRASSKLDRKSFPSPAVSGSKKWKMLFWRDFGLWLFIPLVVFIFSLIVLIEWYFGPTR